MTKSTLVRKKIGDKLYRFDNTKERIVKIINQPNYDTNGESVLIVKDTTSSTIVLDHTSTTSIIIKAMTKVFLQPKKGYIDEYYEELQIEKGACVELEYFEGSWYILSSDGLKLN
jgi:hypothetical protein